MYIENVKVYTPFSELLGAHIRMGKRLSPRFSHQHKRLVSYRSSDVNKSPGTGREPVTGLLKHVSCHESSWLILFEHLHHLFGTQVNVKVHCHQLLGVTR